MCVAEPYLGGVAVLISYIFISKESGLKEEVVPFSISEARGLCCVGVKARTNGLSFGSDTVLSYCIPRTQRHKLHR